MNVDMSLSMRVTQFRDILNCCEITGKQGTQFPLEDGIATFCERLAQLRKKGEKLYLVGNGGSAGVASHSATDFFNVAKLKAFTLHESALLTCMANDFNYENAYARMLGQVMNPGDIVIAISSSGKSLNILNAATNAAEKGGFIVTLSGFSRDNPLRSLGDINIWLNSNDYGFVEIGHQFILHNVSDRFGSGLISEND